MYFVDDIPKYKKKSKNRPPQKAKHKHMCEPCVIEYPSDWFLKPHERSEKTLSEFYGYCTICGKIIGNNPYRDRWWTSIKCYNDTLPYVKVVPTEDGFRELNPSTRTLPTFRADDPFPKFVNPENAIWY